MVDVSKERDERSTGGFSLEGCDWLERFDSALRNGKHVLFYGNVNDLFIPPWRERPFPLGGILCEYFQKLPVVDEKPFNNAYRYFCACNMSSGVTVSDIVKTDKESNRPKNQTFENVLDAANYFYDHMFNDRDPLVVFLDFVDLLFESEDRQAADERKALIKLRHAFINAKVWNEMNGRQNVFIGACSDLGKAPAWLYRDNPTLALIHIPLPDVAERSRFFERCVRSNLVERSDDPNDDGAKETEEYETSFTSLTDGLSLRDLEAIRVGAQGLIHRVDSPRMLREIISAYRYGKQKNPWEQFSEYNQETLRNASETIKKSVKGQDQAVDAVIDMLISAAVGVTMSPAKPMGGKPKGAFFFVGPTGVGKTEMAKALAKLVFQDEGRLKRFDMSEFRQEHAAERLTGAPPGYRGYEEGGQLTNYVKERPFCILLFDEIEKAHPSVLDKFLQILEDGRLTDGKGETVNFSQTVIIFTSNLGASVASRNLGFFTDDVLGLLENSNVNWGDSNNPIWAEANALATDLAKNLESIKDDSPTYEQVSRFFKLAVKDYFVNKIQRLEILNRFGNNVLAFDFLRPKSVEAICVKFLSILAESAWKKRKLKLRFDRSIVDLVQKEMGSQENISKGGRHIRTLLEKYLEQPLTRWIFENLNARVAKNAISNDVLILSVGSDGKFETPRVENAQIPASELIETELPWNKND